MTDGERESIGSVLSAQLDDDDNIYLCINLILHYIYIYIYIYRPIDIMVRVFANGRGHRCSIQDQVISRFKNSTYFLA